MPLGLSLPTNALIDRQRWAGWHLLHRQMLEIDSQDYFCKLQLMQPALFAFLLLIFNSVRILDTTTQQL